MQNMFSQFVIFFHVQNVWSKFMMSFHNFLSNSHHLNINLALSLKLLQFCFKLKSLGMWKLIHLKLLVEIVFVYTLSFQRNYFFMILRCFIYEKLIHTHFFCLSVLFCSFVFISSICFRSAVEYNFYFHFFNFGTEGK